MAVRAPRAAYLTLSVKPWMHRATLALMLALCLSLLAMSKTRHPAAERLRTAISDLLTPLLAAAASPLDAVHGAAAWMGDLGRLYEENKVLRRQNGELLQWQAAAKAMEAENQSLRGMLGLVPPRKSRYITARLVSDLGGPYMHSALIEGGGDNGIKKGEAVIGAKGLIGRIVEAGAASARVLLLSDINSRIPVLAEHAHEKSILIGNNGDLPVLGYLAANSKITVGERIVTSGDGGIFPQGIPVGIVTSAENGTIKVQLFAEALHADYVSIIDYAR